MILSSTSDRTPPPLRNRERVAAETPISFANSRSPTLDAGFGCWMESRNLFRMVSVNAIDAQNPGWSSAD
jgi:hypothetical protein